MRSSWTAAVGILLIFALGCISGALSTSIYYHEHPALLVQRDPAVAAAAMEGRLTRGLDLDPAQRQEIRRVLMDSFQQRRQLQNQLQPQLQTLNVQMIRQIRAVLRPGQLDTFHDNVADFRRGLARAAFRNPGPDEQPPPIDSTNAPPAPPPPSNPVAP